MILKCAIIDDDKVFAEVLEHYVSQVDFFELAGTYYDTDSASKKIDFHEIDFLFLDVEMPGKSGIEFLNGLAIAPPVVVISKKKEYGVDAFDCDAIDFLFKPISFTRFLKAANKVRKFFEDNKKRDNTKRDNLFVRHERIWLRIPTEQILYVKADNNDVIIKTHDKAYKSHIKLKDIQKQLSEKDFLQVHRSYIVKLDKIEKVDGEIIVLNERVIPVSKTFIKEMYKRLNIIG